MKHIVYCLFFTLVLLSSCDKADTELPGCENCDFTCLEENDAAVVTNACTDNWECSFKHTTQSSVNTEQAEGLAGGNKRVFQMINSTEGAANIADDEFTHILVFELEEDRTSFAAEGEELELLRVHFRRICFCTETDFRAVTSGCLQGERQADGSWFVQGNLNVPYSGSDFAFKFEAQFVE